MDIQQLRYFVEIARNKSFTRAAEQLYITQPMLTRVIKQLEQELNAKLIERTSKSFRLTDVGEALYLQAQDLLVRYSDLYRTINDVKSIQSGEVRLSTPGVLLDMYFAPLLVQFRKKFPGIDINILEEGRSWWPGRCCPTGWTWEWSCCPWSDPPSWRPQWWCGTRSG